MSRSQPSRPARHVAAVGLLTVGLLVAALPSTAEANAALRLYPDVADGGGGQLVTHTPFTLFVANNGNGNGDNTAYAVELIVAVLDPTLLGGVTLTFPDGSVVVVTDADLAVGTPEFPCTGRDMPPHNVYPSAFTTVPLGDIAEDTELALMVDVVGQDGVTVHFDAVGSGVRRQGGGTTCTDVYNPFGHDVTVVLGGGGPSPSDYELSIDKTSDVDEVVLGDEVLFTITVANTGDLGLTTGVMTDTIPVVIDPTGNVFPAFSVLQADPLPSSQTDTQIVWQIGDLPVGGAYIATILALFDEPLTEGHEVVNAACAIAGELEEAECDSAAVDVGEASDDEPIGGPGFWCRQIRAALDGLANAQFTLEELEGWLGQINDDSNVFFELRDTTSLALVRTLLCRPNTLDSTAGRLMRHLMTLWFNLASERADPGWTLGELCPGDEELPDGADLSWTIEHVKLEAEAALVGGADDPTLGFWMEVIDFINNSGPPDSCLSVRGDRQIRRLRP